MIVSELPIHNGQVHKPYTHQEYPKALTPPKVKVLNRDQELQLRAQWGQPLPYDGDAKGEAHRESYFQRQAYPKDMQPPQVTVDNAEQERRQLAAWRMGGEDPIDRQTWPQWRFHLEKKPVLVNSEAEAVALGDGWYDTMDAALTEARRQPLPRLGAAEDEQIERERLFRKAAESFVKVDKRWTTDRLRQAVDGGAAEQKPAAA